MKKIKLISKNKRDSSRLDFAINQQILSKSKRSTRAHALPDWLHLSRKRSQLAVFIIVAIIVVAIVALLFAFPKLKTAVGIAKPESPESFIQICVGDVLKENVDALSRQGGSLEPNPYIMYQDEKIQYLCYTPQKYQACVVQIPFLEPHIESEIKNSISGDIDFCFNSLKETYEKAGYSANVKKGDFTVELLPNRILTTMNYEFTFSKGETTQRADSFRVILNNNLYELAGIAQSIMSDEILFGGSSEQAYMEIYTWLKVEKERPLTDTTIYTLTDRNTKNKFKFAVQSWDLN